MEQCTEQQEELTNEFSFSLKCDAQGNTELEFVKDAPKVVGVMMQALESINESFDSPFESRTHFLRSLLATSEQLDAEGTVKMNG